MKIIAIGFAVIAGGLALAGGYSYMQKQAQIQAAIDAQRAAEQAIEDEKAKARHEFDILLNQMLDELATQAQNYRKQRIILKESIHPQNFETPKYAAESYSVFISDIAPALRKSADQIINIFAVYDEKAKQVLETMRADVAQTLLAQWKDMQKEQLTAYVEFFTKEDRLIAANQDLIKFYATNPNSYTYNPDTDSLDFQTNDAAMQEKNLRDAIKALQ